MHSRWAMLAVAGILIPETLEKLGFMEDFSWFDAGSRQYFADPWTLFAVQMALMGWAEGRRWADFVNPGSVDIEPRFPNRKNPTPDVGYPGGLWFDPIMWGRGSPEPVMVLRTKEIKNGRLAMLAFVGFCFQAVYTGEGPLDNLAAHIADPGHCNIFSVGPLFRRAHPPLWFSLPSGAPLSEISGFCRRSRPTEDGGAARSRDLGDDRPEGRKVELTVRALSVEVELSL